MANSCHQSTVNIKKAKAMMNNTKDPPAVRVTLIIERAQLKAQNHLLKLFGETLLNSTTYAPVARKSCKTFTKQY